MARRFTHSRPERKRGGYASSRFIARIMAIVEEYRDRGLKPAGAWAEVMAAVRQMDREAGCD